MRKRKKRREEKPWPERSFRRTWGGRRMRSAGGGGEKPPFLPGDSSISGGRETRARIFIEMKIGEGRIFQGKGKDDWTL